MKHLLRHRDSEALLDGDPLGDDSGLEDVAAFLSDMRVEFGALPAPAPRPTLAATLDGRRELRPASGPVPKPTVPEPGPRVHYRFKPIAAMVASGVALFGGLATAGALPGPAQRVAADLTSHLGIQLPGKTVTNPASNGTGAGHDHHGSTETTSGSGHSKVPGAGGAHLRPAPGSTTATTVPSAGSTILPTPSTVTVAPNLPATPTLPVPLPTIGTMPPLGPLPSIPGVTVPTDHSGMSRKHPIP